MRSQIVRTRGAWLYRGSLLLVSGILAVQVVLDGTAAALADSRPLDAIALSARNSQAWGGAGLAALNSKKPDPALAEQRALHALRIDLTNSEAIQVLGAVADIRQNNARAHELMVRALDVNKRTLLAQLWLIEDAVRRDQVNEALTHFDRALRYSKSAPQLLFPILLNAMKDPGLFGPIRDLLRPRPPWADSFINYGVATETGSVDLARLALTLPYAPTFGGVDLRTLMIPKLVAAGQMSLARSLEDRITMGRWKHASVRDANFSDPSGDIPFTWQLNNGVGITADRGKEADGSPALQIRVDFGRSGELATQLLGLAPGQYSFASRQIPVRPPLKNAAYWSIRCTGALEDLMRVPLNFDAPAVRSTVTVPQGCTSQWLRLGIDPVDSPDGFTGSIQGIAIQQARPVLSAPK